MHFGCNNIMKIMGYIFYFYKTWKFSQVCPEILRKEMEIKHISTTTIVHRHLCIWTTECLSTRFYFIQNTLYYTQCMYDEKVESYYYYYYLIWFRATRIHKWGHLVVISVPKGIQSCFIVISSRTHYFILFTKK